MIFHRSIFLRMISGMLALSMFLVGCAGWTQNSEPPGSTVDITLAESSGTIEFARATKVRDFIFPQDHGPHFDFQTEWWYYTGNLQTEDGERFGYQFTIFRRALSPGAPPEGEGLATNQVYFAHVAVTDISGDVHLFDERFSRGAIGLAGAQVTPFNVWIEDWRVEAVNGDASSVRITAGAEGFEINLELQAEKPIVTHGESGLSAKSDDVGNASYYLSYTRMRTKGAISLAGQTYEVMGSSWFDHEWSTSVLGERAVGWDWFGLQFDDGRELMIYYIRRADGSIDPISGGTLVGVDGEVQTIEAGEVIINPLDTWSSAESGAVYPSGWEINLPGLEMRLTVQPWIKAQEMRVSFTYWEGAVSIRGDQGGREFEGSGFVELTGYLESLDGVLS